MLSLPVVRFPVDAVFVVFPGEVPSVKQCLLCVLTPVIVQGSGCAICALELYDVSLDIFVNPLIVVIADVYFKALSECLASFLKLIHICVIFLNSINRVCWCSDSLAFLLLAGEMVASAYRTVVYPAFRSGSASPFPA